MSKELKKTSKLPRGIRNNNPLNIRIGNTWLGEVPNPTDSEFEQFVSPVYGLRAAFCILRRYIRRYGRNTLRKIINAWAPSNENNTERYISFVADKTNIDPDEIIEFEDVDKITSMVSAMAMMECGQKIPTDIILKAYNLC